jgi:CBS-domain-containing membrane protein
MITRFEALAPQDSLDHAAGQLLATHQQDFPVVDAWGRAVGILPRERLLEGLARAGGTTAVLEVMERDVPIVAPDDGLDQVLLRLRSHPRCPVLVLEGAALVGMVTLENLTEYIEIARRVAPSG